MSEPFHVRQTSEVTQGDEARAWANAALAEVWPEGVGWWRVSWLDDPFTILLECWKERPCDEGAPRFAVTKGGDQ